MSNYINDHFDPDQERMTDNKSGGRVFSLDEWDRLDRILVLGTEGGTYYSSERELTQEALKVLDSLIKKDGVRVVNRTIELSDSGRAPKNDYAVYVMARASVVGDDATRISVYDNFRKVIRTGTHLFQWMNFVKQMGKNFSRGKRRAIENWYFNRSAGSLAYQVLKYRQRRFNGNSWTHRDVMRLIRPSIDDDTKNAIIHWAVKGWDGVGPEPHPEEALQQIWAHERLKESTSINEVKELITKYSLPREAVPSKWFKEETAAKVWDALYQGGIPYTALMRNLGNMGKSGFLLPGTPEAKEIAEKLVDGEWISTSRVHPFSLLTAFMTYSSGHGSRGRGQWTVVKKVSDALEAAFYKSFGNVEDTGKSFLVALDVSGSMSGTYWGGGELMGVPGLTPRVASAAMAMIYARTQTRHKFMAFTKGFIPIDIQDGHTLDQVVQKTSRLPFSSTDCSLPMTWAMENMRDRQYDAFVVFTDNETNSNKTHPHVALKSYRRKSGRDSMLFVNAMTANDFTIADPKDPGMFDFCGFDSAVPRLLVDLVR